MEDREHIATLNSSERRRLAEWLERGSGALIFDRVTFESVVGGGIFVRTRPFKYHAPPAQPRIRGF